LGHSHVDRVIILKKYLEGISCEYVDWIHVAEDMVQWQADENTVMKPQIP